MELQIDSLLPFNKVISSPEEVFDLVEKNGKVILLNDNRPVYIITKANYQEAKATAAQPVKASEYTLQKAMQIVLEDVPGKKMHAAELADEIFNRALYFKRDGQKAKYNQIRARCGHYPDMFEALSGNIIKLKETKDG